MSDNAILALHRRLLRWPGGRWLFSRLIRSLAISMAGPINSSLRPE